MTMTARLDEGLHALGTSVRPVPTPLPLLHPTSAAPALVADGATVSHRELAARVASLVEQLPATTTGRRLVHLPLTRRLDDVVAHLAVLAAGHGPRGDGHTSLRGAATPACPARRRAPWANRAAATLGGRARRADADTLET